MLCRCFRLAFFGWQVGADKPSADGKAVISLVADLVPTAALFQLSGGCQAAVAGILRGMGRQKLPACLLFSGDMKDSPAT